MINDPVSMDLLAEFFESKDDSDDSTSQRNQLTSSSHRSGTQRDPRNPSNSRDRTNEGIGSQQISPDFLSQLSNASFPLVHLQLPPHGGQSHSSGSLNTPSSMDLSATFSPQSGQLPDPAMLHSFLLSAYGNNPAPVSAGLLSSAPLSLNSRSGPGSDNYLPIPWNSRTSNTSLPSSLSPVLSPSYTSEPVTEKPKAPLPKNKPKGSTTTKRKKRAETGLAEPQKKNRKVSVGSSSGDDFSYISFQTPDGVVRQHAIPKKFIRSDPRDALRLEVVTHPPQQIRTRAGVDNTRNFQCVIRAYNVEHLESKYSSLQGFSVSVHLVYANGDNKASEKKKPSSKILQGKLRVPLQVPTWLASFNDLSMTEASAKHHHQEFALAFRLLDPHNNPIKECPVVTSTPFYTFSHQKVLQRIQQVSIRALSATASDSRGGKRINVVGKPFIHTPRLVVLFRVPKLQPPPEEHLLPNVDLSPYRSHSSDDEEAPSSSHPASGGRRTEYVEVRAENVEFYTPSVIFFDVPKCPVPVTKGASCLALVRVSNDGRNFSNDLPFWFSAHAGKCTCNKVCTACEDFREGHIQEFMAHNENSSSHSDEEGGGHHHGSALFPCCASCVDESPVSAAIAAMREQQQPQEDRH